MYDHMVIINETDNVYNLRLCEEIKESDLFLALWIQLCELTIVLTKLAEYLAF